MSPFERGLLKGALAPLHLLWILVSVPVKFCVAVTVWLLFGGLGILVGATNDLIAQLHRWWNLYSN